MTRGQSVSGNTVVVYNIREFLKQEEFLLKETVMPTRSLILLIGGFASVIHDKRTEGTITKNQN